MCVSRIMVVVLAVAACSLPAGADNFSPNSKVNVLRQFDANLTLQTQADWTGYVGGISYPASRAIDGACNWAQINGNNPGTSNRGYLDITLSSKVSISSIYTNFMNNHLPVKYQLYYSTTGFDKMKPLLPDYKAPASGGVQTDVFSAVSAKYLRLEYVGTVTPYILVGEIKAYASDPSSLGRAGYNILSDPAIGGVQIPNNSLYRSSGWHDDPNQAVDLSDTSYLRSNGTAGEQFFVKPLGESCRLIGAAYGFYASDSTQQWGNGMTIKVTNDFTISEDTEWITVYTTAAALTDSGTMLFVDKDGKVFEEGIDVRFIRVSTEGSTAGGALCELEFFIYAPPVPEPATMTLLALGGLALLRRRAV